MTDTPPATSPARAPSSQRLEPLRRIDAGVLNIAYYEAGPSDGPAVMLMHGFPYDIHSYVDVAPRLAAQGCRVIVPYLRGYGPTRFLDKTTPRSGEQAAIGADLIALMNVLHIRRAVFAGYDWGGRAACVGAALWPERCIGLVSVNGYLIQDIAHAMVPVRPEREVPLWYQYYFQIERGRAGLAANRRSIERQHDRRVGHRQHRIDPFDQARLQQRIARLADGAQRPAKAMLFPGKLKQAFAQERIDQFVGGAIDADKGVRRERRRPRIEDHRLGRRVLAWLAANCHSAVG